MATPIGTARRMTAFVHRYHDHRSNDAGLPAAPRYFGD
jgi:hypothetical protein